MEVTEAEYRRIVADRRTEWVRGPRPFLLNGSLEFVREYVVFLDLTRVALKIRKVTLRFTTIRIPLAAVTNVCRHISSLRLWERRIQVTSIVPWQDIFCYCIFQVECRSKELWWLQLFPSGGQELWQGPDAVQI